MRPIRPRFPRARAATAVATLLLLLPLATAGTAPAAGGRVVLGSKQFVNYGRGWGTARPSMIHNGGVPSGSAQRIRWTRWGSRAAIGRGLTPIYRPGGGYYRRLGRIVLRATRIGRCAPGSPRAYLHLDARVVDRPGGRLGRWFAWGGQDDLCRWD